MYVSIILVTANFLSPPGLAAVAFYSNGESDYAAYAIIVYARGHIIQGRH
jgi:hypothetical protein